MYMCVCVSVWFLYMKRHHLYTRERSSKEMRNSIVAKFDG